MHPISKFVDEIIAIDKKKALKLAKILKTKLSKSEWDDLIFFLTEDDTVDYLDEALWIVSNEERAV